MATAAPNHDRNKIAIIVGASRGLGLGLAREFARRGWQVTATARSTAAATELADEVTASDGGIAVEEVDLDRPESVDVLATRLAGHRFDLVFINAGVSGPQHQSADIATPQEVGALMYTNAIAPIRLARRLLPLIVDGGTLAFMSSDMGSVAGNLSGGMELYRASKAALNSLTLQLCCDQCRRPADCGVHHASRLGKDSHGRRRCPARGRGERRRARRYHRGEPPARPSFHRLPGG